MLDRVQALFIDQGAISNDDNRRLVILVGFLDVAHRAALSAGMMDLRLQVSPTGSASLDLFPSYPVPDASFEGPTDEAPYHDMLTRKIWRRPQSADHPAGIALGGICHRPVRLRTRSANVHSFAGIITLAGSAAAPLFHQRYTFHRSANGKLACPHPEAVSELAHRLGSYPDHYLMCAGWDFDGSLLGLESTLPIRTLHDLRKIRAAEHCGDASAEIERLRAKRDGLIFHLHDAAYSAWLPIYAKECAAMGFDPFDHTRPLSAADMAMRGEAADRALRRLPDLK